VFFRASWSCVLVEGQAQGAGGDAQKVEGQVGGGGQEGERLAGWVGGVLNSQLLYCFFISTVQRMDERSWLCAAYVTRTQSVLAILLLFAPS
jgi:hypothetical protein